MRPWQLAALACRAVQQVQAAADGQRSESTALPDPHASPLQAYVRTAPLHTLAPYSAGACSGLRRFLPGGIAPTQACRLCTTTHSLPLSFSTHPCPPQPTPTLRSRVCVGV